MKSLKYTKATKTQINIFHTGIKYRNTIFGIINHIPMILIQLYIYAFGLYWVISSHNEVKQFCCRKCYILVVVPFDENNLAMDICNKK